VSEAEPNWRENAKVLAAEVHRLTAEIGQVKGFIAFNFKDQIAEDGDFAKTVIGLLTRFKPDARFPKGSELFVDAVEITINGEERTVCGPVTYENIEAWTKSGVTVVYHVPGGGGGTLYRGGPSITPVAQMRITAVRTDNA
jgi:hypothetical protein